MQSVRLNCICSTAHRKKQRFCFFTQAARVIGCGISQDLKETHIYLSLRLSRRRWNRGRGFVRLDSLERVLRVSTRGWLVLLEHARALEEALYRPCRRLVSPKGFRSASVATSSCFSPMFQERSQTWRGSQVTQQRGQPLLFLETCGGEQGFELFAPVFILHPQLMKFSSYAFYVGQLMVTGRPVITFCQQKRSGPSTFTRALISLHDSFFISAV